MKKNLQILILSGILLPVFLSAQMDARQAYISTYKQIAMDEMERVGIPASIKMAQAMLESGAGTSTLALQAKNHFGIKCGKNWNGKTMYRKDDDYDDKGKLIASCFRKYESVAFSFRAHSQFLLDNRRYAFLFELEPTDYKAWAKGLKKAGYATSSTYANKLIHIIEEYELYLFDLGIDPTMNDEVIAMEEPVVLERPKPITVSNKPRPAVVSNSNAFAIITINDVKNVKAKQGDTPEKIAELTNVDVKRLIRYNEFISRPNQRFQGGERIYLQPKRTNYRGKKKYHFVKDGEQMIDIAQLYGLRLKNLYEKNRLDPGHEPAKGQRIKIRGGKVPVNQRPRRSWMGNNEKIVVNDFEWENESEKPPMDNESFLEPLGPSTRASSHRISNAKEFTPVISNTASDEIANSESNRNSTSSSDVVWESTSTTSSASKETLLKESLESIVEQPQKTTPIATVPKISKPAPRVHVVSKGETLYRISKYYGISVGALKANNDLSSTTISIGQRLIVD